MSRQIHYARPAIISMIIIGLLFSFGLFSTVSASHEPQVLTDASQGGIKFTVQAQDISRTQLAVFNLSGRPVYTSGWTWGRQLTWRPLSASGAPLANGVYLYLLSSERMTGKLFRQVGVMVVMRGEVTRALELMRASQPEQRTAPPTANILLEHFECYIVGQGEPANVSVQLQDQFDIKAQVSPQYRVANPTRFCNPVNKVRVRPTPAETTKIRNPDWHLTMYEIVEATGANLSPTRTVVVTNQFGKDQELTVTAAISVLVPTQKEPHAAPEKLDHYKCYRAAGKNIGARVHLRDQFRSATNLEVAEPIIFCNPTRKIHENASFGVQNANDHLVCYNITRQDFATTVRIKNQFGGGPLAVRTADILCVPSLKIKYTDQINDPATGASFGCGTPAGALGSLFQSFTPSVSPLVAVSLRFRAGGSFPAGGTNTKIQIRDGSPGGGVLASASGFIPGPIATGTQILVQFDFPAIAVVPGNLYVIEWATTGDAILTWMGSETDPYPGGTAFGCAGTPLDTTDYNFKSFTR